MSRHHNPLDAIRALEVEATPGPWHDSSGLLATEEGRVVSADLDADDVALVVATRNLLPELLALWEVAQGAKSRPGGEVWPFLNDLLDALDALNEAASKEVGE